MHLSCFCKFFYRQSHYFWCVSHTNCKCCAPAGKAVGEEGSTWGFSRRIVQRCFTVLPIGFLFYGVQYRLGNTNNLSLSFSLSLIQSLSSLSFSVLLICLFFPFSLALTHALITLLVHLLTVYSWSIILSRESSPVLCTLPPSWLNVHRTREEDCKCVFVAG